MTTSEEQPNTSQQQQQQNLISSYSDDDNKINKSDNEQDSSNVASTSSLTSAASSASANDTTINSTSQPRLTNISAYKFTPIKDISALREKLKKFFTTQLPKDAIRGSILLSTEGSNINLSGFKDDIEKTKSYLVNLDDVDFKDLLFKETDGGTEHNYRKLRIRLKEEIVTMKRKDIIGNEAPRVKPGELQSWLDKEEDFVILDVRNDYEQSLGTFKNAIKAPINIFNDFPTYAKDLLDKNPDFRQKKIVTVCTGGIKTEKSTVALRDLGCDQAYMLDGGILKYFEDIESGKKEKAYNGDCFVYDRRVAVKPDLSASDCVLCEVCTWPLTPEEQQLDSYVTGISCKYCINSPKRKRFTLRDIAHDEKAPPKPKSAFLMYCDDHTDQDKAELGKQWQTLSFEEKGVYVAKEKEAKKQYKKDITVYLQQLSDEDFESQKRKYTKYNDSCSLRIKKQPVQ